MKNLFYGKNIDDLTANELQLLSTDLQISSLMKRGPSALMTIARSLSLRTKCVNSCINDGGAYSRKEFLNENNLYDNVPLEEVKELSNALTDLEKGISGVINQLMNDMKKAQENEPHNGKIEGGFEMN